MSPIPDQKSGHGTMKRVAKFKKKKNHVRKSVVHWANPISCERVWKWSHLKNSSHLRIIFRHVVTGGCSAWTPTKNRWYRFETFLVHIYRSSTWILDIFWVNVVAIDRRTYHSMHGGSFWYVYIVCCRRPDGWQRNLTPACGMYSWNFLHLRESYTVLHFMPVMYLPL